MNKRHKIRFFLKEHKETTIDYLIKPIHSMLLYFIYTIVFIFNVILILIEKDKD